jgi:phosphate transport system substrate-binding protein
MVKNLSINSLCGTLLGALCILTSYTLPSTAQTPCSNALNYQDVEKALSNSRFESVIGMIQNQRVNFLWCPDYDQKLRKYTMTDQNMAKLQDTILINNCQLRPNTNIIRLRGSSTIGLNIAPTLTSSYLLKNNYQRVRVDSECSGQHLLAVGDRQGPVAFDVIASESGVGGQMLLNKAAEIAMASKQLEIDRPSVAIGYDQIGIIVNKNNPIQNLRLDQVKDIATENISRWSALGVNMNCNSDDTIHFFSRRKGSGTLAEFLSFIGIAHNSDDINNFDPGPHVVDNHLQMAEAVAEDGCAIGYISEFYHGNAKLVTINNITENYSRKLFLYYDTNYANPQITEIVNSFIQYATDRHGGQEAIESLGATPLENTFRAERTDCIHPTGKKLDADIRFDFNSDDLGRRSRSNLDKVRHSLLGAQSVLILGFSDNIGSQRGIQEISERRAAAVRNQLRLPDSVQVDSKGCGVKSSNDEDQDQSRTVEIWH